MVVWVVIFMAAGPAWGQVSTDARRDPLTGEAMPPERVAELRRQVEAAIATLKAEAERLTPEARGEIGEAAGHVFREHRPHDAARPLPPAAGLIVLESIDRRLFDDPYHGAYVRYHLLHVVNQMLDAHHRRVVLGDGGASAEAPLPEAVGRHLASLLADAPRDPWPGVAQQDRYEPRELWERYNRLNESTRVVVGTPPFEESFRGREALRYVDDAERRAEIERALEQMRRLRPRLRREIDQASRRYNARIGDFNQVSRGYFSDLVKGLIRGGFDGGLDRVLGILQTQLGERQRLAFDLVDLMYAAVSDGYLRLYDPREIDAFRRGLERLANRNKAFVRLRDGAEPVDGPQGLRSFHDATFHLVQLLGKPTLLDSFVFDRPGADPTTYPGRDPIDADPKTLTADQVRLAIQRAVGRVNHPRRYDKDLHPRVGLDGHRLGDDPDDVHDAGHHAMLGWALLAAGESSQSPRLYDRIHAVLAEDTPFTFDRAMRLQMLRYLPRGQYLPWLERDARWLTEAMRTEPPLVGTFPAAFRGDDPRPGDNVQALYGVLGLAAAQDAGLALDTDAWRAVDFHWRRVQQRTPGDQPAGWARGFYNLTDDVRQRLPGNLGDELEADGPPDPLMTAAGSLALDLAQRQLGPPETRRGPTLPPGASGDELDKGLDWLDQRFTVDVAGEADFEWYYRMWLMQQLGLSTGIRRFNGVDWVRDVTAAMIERQHPSGIWYDRDGSHDKAVPTTFGLLYLAAALRPVAASKLRLADAEWNANPRDLYNFVDYASDLYEVETSWQILDPDAPLIELQDSPILFLSTGEGFELTDAEIDNLRDYIALGGLLVTNAERGQADLQAFRRLYARLFPQRTEAAGNGSPLVAAPRDHEIFTLHQQVEGIPLVQVVENGVRTLAVHFPRSLAEGLQKDDRLRSDSFAMLSNLYLYSVGYNPRRARLDSRIVLPDDEAATHGRLAVARVRHDGEFDPEPFVAPQLKSLAANRLGLDVSIDTRLPGDLGGVDLALLSTTGDASDPLSDDAADALRQYLEAGGTLWLDATGGSAAAIDAARRAARDILPGARTGPLPNTHPVLAGRRDADGRLLAGYDCTRVRYRFYALRRMQPSSRPRLQGVYLGDRPAILLSEEDLTSGVAGLPHWGIFGYDIESSRRLLLNGLLHAQDPPRVKE